MSQEEYHARQQANEAQNQAAVASAARQRAAKAQRHLKRALELLDPHVNAEAYREIENALKELR